MRTEYINGSGTKVIPGSAKYKLRKNLFSTSGEKSEAEDANRTMRSHWKPMVLPFVNMSRKLAKSYADL